MRRRTWGRRRSTSRQGTASVEFALCLPILIVFVFGAVETSNAVYLQSGLTSACYEASNYVTDSGNTSATAQTRANAVLTSLGINGGTVTISPTVTASTALGTQITITCSAPLSSNSVMFGVLGSRTLTARIICKRL